MINVTNKYKDMIESFECDFNLVFEDRFGIIYFTQMLNRIKSNSNLTKQDLKFLEDLELLRELSFNLRHGIVSIVENFKIEIKKVGLDYERKIN